MKANTRGCFPVLWVFKFYAGFAFFSTDILQRCCDADEHRRYIQIFWMAAYLAGVLGSLVGTNVDGMSIATMTP